MMLARWGFEPQWVKLPREVDDWQRPGEAMDYCTLLQVVHFCHEPAARPVDVPRNALRAHGWTPEQAQEHLTRALGRVKGATSLMREA
jgi:hypothetical protein